MGNYGRERQEDGILTKLRKINEKYDSEDGIPLRLTRDDYEDIKNRLPPQDWQDFEQGIWDDLVEMNRREIEIATNRALRRMEQALMQSRHDIAGVAVDVQSIRNEVSNRPQREGFSTKEVAEMVGKSDWTIRRWIKSGKLSATRTSERDPFIIQREDIEGFMAEFGTGSYGLTLA